MLIGTMVNGNVEDDIDAALMRLLQEITEYFFLTVSFYGWLQAQKICPDTIIIPNIKTSIPHRRIKNGEQPETINAQVL